MSGTGSPVPRIAFDLTPLQNAHRYRGIGTYVRGLARRLAVQSNVPIEFWGWSGDVGMDSIPPPHRLVQLPRVPMPQYRGAWLFARLAMRLRKQRSRVQAVHITDPDALTRLGGHKVLATVYDLIPLKRREQGERRRQLRGLIARSGYDSYLRELQLADMLFAISEQTADDVSRLLGIPASRIRVAAPGVDLPPSSGTHTDQARPYFLYLGGPNPNKNLGVLLDAFASRGELSEQLLIGGHWLPKQVATLNRHLSARGLSARVRYLGFVPPAEITGLMRGATALVVPSLQEGFGLPVAEGLAAGAVVIHSRLPVLEETSLGSALTFDPNSATELARCLLSAARDSALAASLRARGQERAAALTWDEAVTTTLAAYRSVLAA
ncbi:MAG TPA: glycosyltransferase family 1 protein [Candidatus Dormibacteraeota bacterium]|nr:glycosyltransferase family 1 protein [Candidatus Dormibacteraeota bacterium]